jgi:hypothetical protein
MFFLSDKPQPLRSLKMAKTILLVGKIEKRNGRVANQSVKADWLTSISFPAIGKK